MRTIVRTLSFNKKFICYVADIYNKICDFISKEWIGKGEKSIRQFATSHDIDEKTARRIKNWKSNNYRITLYTLEKICQSREITLEEFFKAIAK